MVCIRAAFIHIAYVLITLYVNISCIKHNTFTLPTPTESKVMVHHKVAFRYFYDH